MVIVDFVELEQAHHYILHNSAEVQWIQNEHTCTFILWFRNQVLKELSNPNNAVSETLRWLAERPKVHVFIYSSYIVNGYQFYTRMKDMQSTTQNSGDTLVVQVLHVSSAKDMQSTV
ncbi:hypothetical protein UlMin_006931 [Ulmus minor]